MELLQSAALSVVAVGGHAGRGGGGSWVEAGGAVEAADFEAGVGGEVGDTVGVRQEGAGKTGMPPFASPLRRQGRGEKVKVKLSNLILPRPDSYGEIRYPETSAPFHAPEGIRLHPTRCVFRHRCDVATGMPVW